VKIWKLTAEWLSVFEGRRWNTQLVCNIVRFLMICLLVWLFCKLPICFLVTRQKQHVLSGQYKTVLLTSAEPKILDPLHLLSRTFLEKHHWYAQSGTKQETVWSCFLLVCVSLCTLCRLCVILCLYTAGTFTLTVTLGLAYWRNPKHVVGPLTT